MLRSAFRNLERVPKQNAERTIMSTLVQAYLLFISDWVFLIKRVDAKDRFSMRVKLHR